MNATLMYVTVGNKEEARNIGRTLLEERLVACVNLIDRMESMYWWEGKIQEDTEVVLIAKTTAQRIAQVVEKIKAIHSYEVPCIVSLPITAGNDAFLSWIETETR